MTKQKNDINPSPVKPCTPGQTGDTVEATVSKNAAGAESQVAPAASDSPGDTAPSPVTHDAIGNPDMPEQATDANPSPADPLIAVPTSPQDETPEAAATKDEAGAVSQVLAAPSNTPENNLTPIADGYVEQPAKLDDCGCFEPFIPQHPVSPAPKPAPKPKPSSWVTLIDKWQRDNGLATTPTDTKSETASPAPAAAEGNGDAEMAQPNEILPAPAEAPLPPPRFATAVELFNWIRAFLS
jgi:hypothetical protein